LAAWDKGGARLSPVLREFSRRAGDARGLPSAIVYKNPTLLGSLLLRMLAQDPSTRDQLRASAEITALSAATEPAAARPTLAEARAVLRLLPDEDPNAFLGELRRVLDLDRLSLEVTQMDPPAVETSYESPFFEAIESAARRVFPGKIVAPVIAPERSLASPFAFAGVPVLRLPLPAEQPGAQESLELSELRDAIELVFQTLYGVAAREGDPFQDLIAHRY
jgi:acetylornithine deacetylase/succinyl-diaminopimelate desuccinylase-like protein